MPQREFEITIARDGTVELYVQGFKGKGCLEAVKMFEKIVGELESKQATSEFYEQDEEVRYRIEQGNQSSQ
jgi:hypothetical protein